MHPGIRELLTLRDGAPVAAHIAEHAKACSQCSGELARLKAMGAQLRKLPAAAPPQRAWVAIEQALSHPAPTPMRAPHRRAAALVAGLLGAAVLSVLLWQSQREPVAASRPPAQSLASLVARSQQLEGLLRGLPRPAVEQAATAAAIDELQSRIQVLDAQLSGAEGGGLDRAQAQQLWAARVQLLDSLVSVRYAEHAARSDFWPPDSTGDI